MATETTCFVTKILQNIFLSLKNTGLKLNDHLHFWIIYAYVKTIYKKKKKKKKKKANMSTVWKHLKLKMQKSLQAPTARAASASQVSDEKRKAVVVADYCMMTEIAKWS